MRIPSKYIKVPCNECGTIKRRINGQYLRYLREYRMELTQRDFALRLDLSSPYISDIERNRRDCPLNILKLYLEFE